MLIQFENRVQVESQEAVQRKIFQERCVELQAKLDKSRVAYYDRGRELEVLRVQFEEQKQQLQVLEEKQENSDKETRTMDLLIFVEDGEFRDKIIQRKCT